MTAPSSADFPYDMERVLAAMPKGWNNSSLRALGAVAAAMTDLGHPTRVWSRQAAALLDQADAQIPQARGGVKQHQHKIYALELHGQLLSFELDRDWNAMLRRFHGTAIAEGYGETDAAREWETLYSGPPRETSGRADHLDMRVATALLLAHPNPDYSPAPKPAYPIDARVRELLLLGRREQLIAIALSEALRAAGMDARAVRDVAIRDEDGIREQRAEVRVEYGARGERILITDEYSEDRISYTSANAYGFLPRQSTHGVHEIQYGPEHVDALAVAHCQELVARIVHAELERDVAGASEGPRTRM